MLEAPNVHNNINKYVAMLFSVRLSNESAQGNSNLRKHRKVLLPYYASAAMLNN